MNPVPTNGEVARIFQGIADALEMQGENAFKIRAYRHAVSVLHALEAPVADIAAEGRLDDVPSFGPAIRGKITDILQTGTTPLYERLKDAVPPGVLTLLALPGLGVGAVRQVWQGLGVDSVAGLEEAAKTGKVAALPGMGEKTAQKILAAIDRARRYGNRLRLGDALPLAETLAQTLRARPEVERLDIAGSVRRGCETVGDINLVGQSRERTATLDAFAHLPQAGRVVARDETTARIALHSGVEVELTLAADGEYGPLLQTRTGARAHNAQLERLAQRNPVTAGDDENAVYAARGLPFIPPELRENRGEIESAQAGTMPRLIEQSDIRGDVHAHTTASDGTARIEDMARAAKARGYEYLAITDHSQHVKIARGLTPDRLRAQIARIRTLQDSLGIALFAGSEVDILADGTLDFDDVLLAELDFVIASAHLHNTQDEAAQTKRLVRALENPHVDMLAHPTGRLLNKRDPYPVDMEAVVDAARRTGSALEINASPERLDLSDIHARLAGERGVPIVINTDAHAPDDFDLMRYGILVARRAWLGAENVLNTRPLADFQAWLDR